MSKHDFSTVPSVNFRRSKFPLNHGIKTSFNVGELVPLDITEVVPGDTFKSKLTGVVRATTPFIKPIMDNLFMDVYHFFVPYRLCYDKAEQVFGKASPSMYIDDVLESFPTLPACEISKKSVGDYLGLPLGNLPEGISAMPFRAFAKIYNEWFRDENNVDEVFVQDGELAESERPNDKAWSPNNYFGKLPHVGKKKDYFTSCHLRPQKGSPVLLPLGQTAPVVSTGQPLSFEGSISGVNPLYFVSTSNIASDGQGSVSLYNGDTINGTSQDILKFANRGLMADLSLATSANVNDIRFAFQAQKMLELSSIYGDRYREFTLAHFGVSSPDMRLQVPEFLGGNRINIQVQQTTQTSIGTEASPLGEVGAYSLSMGNSSFVKGFTEHGYIVSVACVRQIHSYQQGIHKMWFRKVKDDVYDPLWAHLGEQPVFTSELYGNVSSLKGNVFGYNEAWAEYRYKPNSITGLMRSASESDLDVWHLADKFDSAPVLNQSFVEENAQNIDRVLTAGSKNIDNFIFDGYFETEAIRVMPTYSIPGLIDHR